MIDTKMILNIITLLKNSYTIEKDYLNQEIIKTTLETYTNFLRDLSNNNQVASVENKDFKLTSI